MSEDINDPWIENDGQRLILDPKFGLARPIAEYHEDMGPVLWWKFPIEEAPYVGSPNDCGRTIGVSVSVGTAVGWPVAREGENAQMTHYDIGGWPGYHTHFTPIPVPKVPK